MIYNEGDEVTISSICKHKEIAGKSVVIDHIDEGHNRRDAYFIRDGGCFLEVKEDDVVNRNTPIIKIVCAFCREHKPLVSIGEHDKQTDCCEDCWKRRKE